MEFLELFEYGFFQNALLGSLFASIACGIIGTYVVVRRLVFISGGITHTSLGGLGLGFYLGVNPVLSAMVFSVLSAFGIQWVSSKQGVREDSAIAVFWSLGMAVGIIFIFLKSGFAPNLSEYLFGNILTITQSNILYLAILSVVLTLFYIIFRHEIIYVAFDSDFARTRNIPVKFIEYLMMFFIAVSIVLSIRLVGIVLLMSLLTVPQMTANLFSSNYTKIMLASIVIGFLGCVGGLFSSYFLNVPSGAFIIFVLIVIFLVCKLFLMFRPSKTVR
ncbi:metal ABC transporter permease [Dysgonomonas sp. 216]|uniref:metal ABC transporter permease n=1 Tax=Dysgonomonas sp. 216 TaxID=2302934 RepID=UPI0013D4EB07|nr:metal ABC transporter permease [Dysgonomonas sp. 216]NDW18970.1 metal ABC transporter permease [Dysgonomonas sp. 216]